MRHDYPALTPADVHHGAYGELFADRYDLIREMEFTYDAGQDGPVVAEVGVAFGDFSRFLIDTLKPSRFIAIDTFKIHMLDTVMGVPVRDRIPAGRSHADWYAEQMHSYGIVDRWEYPSDIGLNCSSPDGTIDVVYLDAGHTYEEVRKDLQMANLKVSPGGVIVCNDYTPYDVLPDGSAGGPYGVIPAVNQFVAAGGWEVFAFALEKHGFHDIALRRRP